MKSATKMYESSRLYVVARSNTAFEAACALCSPARTIPAADAAAALTLVLPTAWPDDMVMAMADAMRACLTPGVFVPSGIRYTRTGVT